MCAELRDVASDLAVAIVLKSTSPLVLLDERLGVIVASDSFCRSFGIHPNDTAGKLLTSLGNGEWASPQLGSLLEATMSGGILIPTYEMVLNRSAHDAQRLVVTATKLEYGQLERARLLVAVTDVTASWNNAHEKSLLLAEKAVLLQEVQHRVANSLQIIASILLQSARRVQSDETRIYLTDAHSRVMSLAALQQQLAIGASPEVELRSYFTQLCKSLGASMIHDAKTQRIIVDCDVAISSASESVSLGLIVTELVINALKHAFPDGKGTITLSYKEEGLTWKLCVRDDGVGMLTEPSGTGAGLGTSLINALAEKLDAVVSINNAHPGTEVCVRH